MKYILFSINTGRSGSKFIASLCNGFDNVASFHEPKPALCGKPMSNYQLGDKRAFDGLLEIKLKKIREHLVEKDIYFESNHYFIKGFGWELIEELKKEGIPIGIVILTRDSDKIVNSFFRIGTSLIGRGAENHLLHPEATLVEAPFFKNGFLDRMGLYFRRVVTLVYNIPYYLKLRKLKSFKLFEAYQKRYLRWYIEQHHFLLDKFRNTYPDLKYLEVDIEMDQEEILKLMQLHFGMKDFKEKDIDQNKGTDYIKKAKNR